MIKYILLLPFLMFYLLRDMAMLLKHQELLRGISILILTALVGIFFTAWLNLVKSQYRVKRKLGNDVYEWLEKE